MSTTPVNFANGSQLVLSVLKKGSTVGTANYDKIVLYQRYSIGTLGIAEHAGHRRSGVVWPGARLRGQQLRHQRQLADHNLPANVDVTRGGLLYVTEVFTQHAPLTPLNKFGVTIPPTLRSIAYF